MLELNNQNFSKEVLKSEVPVLVDFWAPWCIEPDAEILINHNTTKHARYIVKDEAILSYSGKKLISDKITYSAESSKLGHCKMVVTETGRSIKVTDEHLFLTNRGWMEAQRLQSGDFVATYTMPTPLSVKPVKKQVLVTENIIRRVATASMNTESYIKELKLRDLLPLTNKHPSLEILARIAGFLFTDGGLYRNDKNNYREIYFSVGMKQDVQCILKDLKQLGFSYVHAREQTAIRSIGGRKFNQHTFKVKCLSTSLWLLLRSLGVPGGNKVEQGYHIPKWLFNASASAKSEFLGGFMGGDGPCIKMVIQKRAKTGKKPYNKLVVNDLEFFKTTNCITQGLRFATELKSLFYKLGIKINKIFIENANFPRHDGSKSSVIHIKFNGSFENIKLLLSAVGYRYALTKSKTSLLVNEFLRRILVMRASRKALFRKANQKYKQGFSIEDIATKLKLPYNTVYGWLKYKNTPSAGYHSLKFDKWHRTVTNKLVDGLAWDRVETTIPAYLKTVKKITVANYHNFIANGFLVHNCGPCRAVSPVIEELAEEYKNKALKIAKLNVDEAGDIASKYGVMSIPTLIFFKNGKAVEQMVGVQEKHKLQLRVEALMK